MHGAMTVRKVDSTGPAAFGSPVTGPLGRVVEGRLWLQARPVRPVALSVTQLAGRVDVITATLGDDGALLRDSAAKAEGAERDLRASGAVCAPFLSPVAARIVLLACLGAGLQGAEMAAALGPWDAG